MDSGSVVIVVLCANDSSCLVQDGTLTVPCIDFALMRRRAGIMSGDILEELAKLDAEGQARARAAIWEVEQQVKLISAGDWTA